MKKNLIVLLIGLQSFCYAQTGNVGINTSIPTHTMDINGMARIRTINPSKTHPDFVLVADSEGEVQKSPVSDIIGTPEVIQKRIYAVISKNAKQALPKKFVDYDFIFDGEVRGINTNKLSISTDKSTITLPPDKSFKITGFIGIAGRANGYRKDDPAYITSIFEAGGNATTIISTMGYVESSTETFDDGGTSNPMIILTTGKTGANTVKLKVQYGQSENPTGYNISGAPTRDTLGSYILIEEL